jgi:hypothetical protein
VIAAIFAGIGQIFYNRLGFDWKTITKGVVERLFIAFALIHDYPTALTFFGALKLATRLKRSDNEDSQPFNDYYLVGNLVSVALAIAYVVVWKNPSVLSLP